LRVASDGVERRSAGNERRLDVDPVVEAGAHLGPTQTPLAPSDLGVGVKSEGCFAFDPEGDLKLTWSADAVDGKVAFYSALSWETEKALVTSKTPSP
jgi:hypothetical protein